MQKEYGTHDKIPYKTLTREDVTHDMNPYADETLNRGATHDTNLIKGGAYRIMVVCLYPIRSHTPFFLIAISWTLQTRFWGRPPI